MLKRLHLQNFTVFADADFQFGPGLNVLVGTNGTGKSHVLKVGYIATRVTARILNDETDTLAPGLNNWQVYLSQRLKDVFQPEYLGQLVRWEAIENNASIVAEFKANHTAELIFDFSAAATEPDGYGNFPVHVSSYPEAVSFYQGIFIPPKEVFTLLWLRDLYRRRILPIDDTYPALLDLLSEKPLREPSEVAQRALRTLESILGGQIEVNGDRSYIVMKNRRVEMNLAAEGLRKFAMLERLLRNGMLIPENPLFWDEPEANLNPALLRKLAAILAELARQGFQIILATHSTDLLKEFHILSRQKDAKPLPIKYFGLNAEPGQATRIVTTDNFEHLPDVVALSEELKQADELEEIFIREDREYYANNRGEEPGI